MTNTMKYDEIIDKTDAAVCFKIDGANVWLPRTRLVVNEARNLVQSDLLEKNLRMAKTANEVADLGPVVWKNDKGTSVAHDVTVHLDQGDPDLSTIQVRVFVPTSIETNGGEAVPHWLINQAIDRQASTMVTGQDYTVRNSNGDAIIVTKPAEKEEEPSTDDIPVSDDIPISPEPEARPTGPTITMADAMRDMGHTEADIAEVTGQDAASDEEAAATE